MSSKNNRRTLRSYPSLALNTHKNVNNNKAFSHLIQNNIINFISSHHLNIKCDSRSQPRVISLNNTKLATENQIDQKVDL